MKKITLAIVLICIILVYTGCARIMDIAHNLADAAQENSQEDEEEDDSIQDAVHEVEPFATQVPQYEPIDVGTEDIALSPAEIFEYNADAVFTLYSTMDNEYFFPIGSGFFVCETGLAITNHHVIVNWTQVIIRTHGGHEYNVLGYYYYYLGADLAVIQVEGSDFTYLTLGDSDALRIGDSVYAIGSPLGYHNTFSNGVVSRFDDVTNFDIYRVYGMIQFTAPISGGSSGGALLNDRGQVIGITTAGYGREVAQAINFAVPISLVELDSIVSGTHNPLPVGATAYMADVQLVGTWLWSSGNYTFYADGSGNRVWDGYHANFGWTLAGTMLSLNLSDGTTEQWRITVSSENSITIGGAHFSRTMNDQALQLEGNWIWDGGHYVFNADGSGHRVWDVEATNFSWRIEGDVLTLTLANGEEEHYIVSVLDPLQITVGGAIFTRTYAEPANAAQLIGTWDWNGGTYIFNADGTGSRTWSNESGEFIWRVVDSILLLLFEDADDERWAVLFVNENEMNVGGAAFMRIG